MTEIDFNNLKIETPNLTLRPLKKSDATSITKYLQAKEISNNTLSFPYPYSLEEAYKFIKKQKKLKNYCLHYILEFIIKN